MLEGNISHQDLLHPRRLPLHGRRSVFGLAGRNRLGPRRLGHPIALELLEAAGGRRWSWLSSYLVSWRCRGCKMRTR